MSIYAMVGKEDRVMTKSIKFTFPNQQGERLSAVLEMPADHAVGFAILAHCFACSKDILAAARIARALVHDHIAVLRFDFTGLGKSEGDFAQTNFTTNVMDVVCAANYLRNNYQAPRLLVGHSLGGAAVIKAAAYMEEVQAIATIGAPSDPAHVSQHFAQHVDEIEKKGGAKVLLAGIERTITKQFLEDLKQQDLIAILRNRRKLALLICHSPIDNVVNIEHAAALYLAAHHPKSFISLDDTDHLVTRKEDAEYLSSIIGAWAKRYIK